MAEIRRDGGCRIWRCDGDALHRYTVTQFTMEASFKHKAPRLAMNALMATILVVVALLLRKFAVGLLVRVGFAK